LPVGALRYARGMVWQRDPERPDPAEPSRQRVRETLVERQIREAMDDGLFDGLPYQGNGSRWRMTPLRETGRWPIDS